jgi:hypothetical protein
MMAVFAVAGWWTVTTLFPIELHQVGQWMQAKFESLRN